MSSRRTAILGVIALFGLLALGCGAAQQAARTGEEAGGGAPRPGGTLNVRMTTDPWVWDLRYNGQAPPNSEGLGFVYNSLLGYQAGPDVGYNDGILVPELAETWEVSPDARTFTFHLRKGVRFADLPPANGREITSADVKWSFEYWSSTGPFEDLGPALLSWMYTGLDQVDAPDPYTVAVHFKEPYIPFLRYAAADWAPVVPHEIYDQDGHLKDRATGSGPYQLDTTASQKGVRWVWKKNRTYWESGKPYIDQVHWVIIPDGSTALAAFQTRQIDVLPQRIDQATAQDLKARVPDAVMYEYESGYPQKILMQQRRAPFNDVRVRKALALAIDRDEFIRTLQGGRGSWWMPGVFAGFFTEEEAKRLQTYDPEAARRLLREAGYGEGVDIELEFPQDESSDAQAQKQLLQAQLKKVGFNITLKGIDPASFSAKNKKGDFAMRLYSGGDARWDVDFILNDYDPTSVRDYQGVDDPDLTRLILAQRAEPDNERRRDLVRRASLRIVEQAHGVGLYSLISYNFWQPSLKNYAPNWNIPVTPIVNAWLDRQP